VTESCEAGSCQQRCRPDNCNGCCSTETIGGLLQLTCLPGNTNEKCGAGGLECNMCFNPEEPCSQGACRPKAPTTDPGIGQACGSLTLEGDCVANWARWCDPSTSKVAAVDCSLEGNACGMAPSFGSICVAPAGRACYFEEEGIDGYYTHACGVGTQTSPSMACDVFDGCVDGIGSCTPPPVGQSFAPVCVGTRLVMACSTWGQGVVASCVSSSIGGTGCSAGNCVGIRSGFGCGQGFQCASGLTCNAGVCR
jgi:hypothetical protein